MLDLKTLKVGDKVRVVNNVDNNVEYLRGVNIGDVGTVKSVLFVVGKVEVDLETVSGVYFLPHQLKSLSPSDDLIIYKSRWDEIIENLSEPLNCMTDEEVEIVKSVLKNNIPFSIVPDLKVIDSVIEKEDQTHLDANYVGVGRNGCFYYRSDILKQWFYWNEDYEWGECDFDYNDIGDVLPVSFGIVIGESKWV
mgnify:CR=1 FL=1